MLSRRTLFRSILAAGALALGERLTQAAQPTAGRALWLPLLQAGITDMPIIAPPSGTTAQAINYIAPRALVYTADDVRLIVTTYQQVGEPVGVDWFLALAQMVHETGSLTSWWSQRPRRNPAGIGVTGNTQPGTPDAPPGPDWAWHDDHWEEGVSFATWANDAIPAHLGRLLAYALTDAQMTEAQLALTDKALSYRGLPASYRGSAPTIIGLNGRWAVPGTNYGQAIIATVQRMKDEG